MSEELSCKVVDVTREWIGTPYIHQASRKGAGADCLGLVRGVWRELIGPERELVPAYTADWGETRGTELLWSAAARHLVEKRPQEMCRGDVLLFRVKRGRIAKHVGILSESDPFPSFIHAFSGHGVVESALTTTWRMSVVACFSFPTGDT